MVDFPLDLDSKRSLVKDTERVRQEVFIRLKNVVGSFVQAGDVGAHFSIHGSNDSELSVGVRATLEQIEDITINRIQVYNHVVSVDVTYNDNIFSYNLNYE